MKFTLMKLSTQLTSKCMHTHVKLMTLVDRYEIATKDLFARI